MRGSLSIKSNLKINAPRRQLDAKSARPRAGVPAGLRCAEQKRRRQLAFPGVLLELQRRMANNASHDVCLCWLMASFMAGAAHLRVLANETPDHTNAPLKYEEPRFIRGAIYAQGEGNQRLLFLLQRKATRAGNKLDVLRDYTYPDGTLAARERVVYEGDELVSYALEELQIGAEGHAEIRRMPGNPPKSRIVFTYIRDNNDRPKTNSEDLAEDTLVNDMIGPFLQSHWDALARGETVRCRYLVLTHWRSVGFNLVRVSESKWRGRDAIMVKMAASNLFISALVDPLLFTIEKAPPHHVLQYVGRTTPLMQAGKNWKTLDAVTVFDWESAR